MSKTVKGYILGVFSAVCYGTNPLFAVPCYACGLTVASVLFYRYLIASIILAVVMLIRGVSFKLNRGQFGFLLLMGVLFALSSIFMFESYHHMDVGIASTLIFMQPVFIALILWLFFHEKISLRTIIAIAVCLVGVTCLCNPGEGAYVTVTGVVLILLSALSYGIYMVIVNKSRIRNVPGLTITFYSLVFGQLVFACTTKGFTEIQPLWNQELIAWGCVFGLALVSTVGALLTVAIAIKLVGSVIVAILGAFEPITGICVGALIFGEILTPRVILGIVLVLLSVVTIVFKPIHIKHRPHFGHFGHTKESD